MGEARKISVSLRPAMIDQLGIIATISWFCREYQKTYAGIDIEQHTDLQEERVPQPLKIIIYRVLQESLTNIAKHSNARHVSVSLDKRNGWLNLVIEDDGRGFDRSSIAVHPTTQNGFGLMSMKERVELSGGEFEVDSNVGDGTRISASWKI
jgi:signal transduction histidine kinase